MKRLILAAVALSIFAAPAAYAGERGPTRYDTHKYERYTGPKSSYGMYKPHVVKKPRWAKGQRYSDWRRHQEVRDWNRRGLHRPGRGQEWIRVGNDYLLVGIMSGVIAGMIAAR